MRFLFVEQIALGYREHELLRVSLNADLFGRSIPLNLLSILGGLYVVHAGDKGIAYEHVEKVWGDIASAQEVLQACGRVSGVTVDEAALAKAREEHENLHERMANSSIGQAKRAAAQDVLDAAPSTAPAQSSTL